MAHKAREVREILSKTNLDPRVKHILEANAEEVYMQHKAIKEIAVELDRFATLLNELLNGVLATADNQDKITKRLGGVESMEAPNVTK